MKKLSLFITLIALCIAFYYVSAVYASICTLTIVPNSSKISIEITNDYKNPVLSKLPLHTYGDPINDPRPRMIIPRRPNPI